MKVLVTGTSGQLGSYVGELIAEDHAVSGMDIRPCPYKALQALASKGDIRMPADVRKAVRNVDAIVHCAAQVSVERSIQNPLLDAETNVIGTLNLLAAGAKAEVSKFIYVSSAAVYGNPQYLPVDEKHPTDPLSNYGASKLAGEKFALAYARTSAMDVVSVRPFNFYSPRADPKSPYSGVITKFVSRVKSGKPPIIEGDGMQTRDFIHARDVAAMIRLVIVKEGLSAEIFNCGSGKSTSILDLADITIAASGKKLVPGFAEPRKGDIRHSLAHTQHSRKVLGFRPRTSLRAGIEELLQRS
jgi:UDP-glucose 4-epimerase